jgi:hypothetical protein
LGEAETVFRVEVESEPLGSGEAETVFWSRGRVRALGSGEAETVFWSMVESEPWGRVRQRPSSKVEVESEP